MWNVAAFLWNSLNHIIFLIYHHPDCQYTGPSHFQPLLLWTIGVDVAASLRESCWCCWKTFLYQRNETRWNIYLDPCMKHLEGQRFYFTSLMPCLSLFCKVWCKSYLTFVLVLFIKLIQMYCYHLLMNKENGPQRSAQNCGSYWHSYTYWIMRADRFNHSVCGAGGCLTKQCTHPKKDITRHNSVFRKQLSVTCDSNWKTKNSQTKKK